MDYLLKPIEFERFLKAVNRAQDQALLKQKTGRIQAAENTMVDFILVKDGTDIKKINVKDILYIQSAGNYVTFNLARSKIMTLLSMNKVLQMLPPNHFFRIHKSYIIALRHISKIERHQVIIANKEIPIGSIFRQSFFNAIESKP